MPTSERDLAIRFLQLPLTVQRQIIRDLGHHTATDDDFTPQEWRNVVLARVAAHRDLGRLEQALDRVAPRPAPTAAVVGVDFVRAVHVPLYSVWREDGTLVVATTNRRRAEAQLTTTDSITVQHVLVSADQLSNKILPGSMAGTD